MRRRGWETARINRRKFAQIRRRHQKVWAVLLFPPMLVLMLMALSWLVGLFTSEWHWGPGTP